MNVTRRHLRLVRSAPPAPSRKPPDLGEVDFVYASYTQRMVDVSPTAYLRPIRGCIEHAGLREAMGRFRLVYVDIDQVMDEGRSLGRVMEGASTDLGTIFAALYDPDSICELRKDAADIVGWVSFTNLLVVDSIELLPTHRGMGLGAGVLRELIRRHAAGCGVVAAIVTPLQFRPRSGNRERDDYERRMDYRSFGWGMDEARRKLTALFEKSGFRQIGTGGVVAMSTGVRRDVAEALRGLVPDPSGGRIWNPGD